jgi:PQQ-dependent dehydrogenase (methanol/ethanol family)
MAASSGAAPPQPPASAVPAEDGNWTMPGKNAASTRFSGLDELNTQNVGNLRVEFTFSTGVLRGHEAAPIVQGDTMYVITPYPNHVYALDLSKPGARLKWRYDPKPMAAAQGIACCDVVNRGVTVVGDTLYLSTLDGQAIALDAASGKERWRKQLGNINKGETITMAPFVAAGKVLVGNSGGEYGVRGWVVALDAKTGNESWRAYNTGPDAEVLIGPRFAPFYESDRGKDLGVQSWPPEAWKIGGGTMWGWMSYDPDRGIPSSGPATTSGPAAFLRATSRPARRAGSTRPCRMTCTTTTRSTRSYCSTWSSTGSSARCWCARSATVTCTSSIASRAKCWPRMPIRMSTRSLPSI